MKRYTGLFTFIITLISLPGISQGSNAFEQVRRYTQAEKASRFDSLQTSFTNTIGNDVHYLYPLYQGIGWESRFRRLLGERAFNENFSQMLSFVGDHRAADEYAQKNYEKLTPAETRSIQQYINGLRNVQTIDAQTYITGRAMSASVVMINEAHNRPQHRAFTYSLLDALYQEGFRYLAMETFTHAAGYALNELNIFTGFYTKEPVGGELVRHALALGYTLVPYEDTAGARHTPSERDSIQAANIYRVLQQDKDAKILVHAGYGHISKEQVGSGYTPMGLAFKKLSGIDPLTIDQTVLTEGSIFEYGRLFYQYLLQKLPLAEPTVVLQNKKQIDLGQAGYDIIVVHPPVVYRNNRPTWLSLGGVRKETPVAPGEKKLFLVQAYYADEYHEDIIGQLVPADQTYIASGNGYYSLYLAPGRYRLVFRDVAYHKLAEKEITVTR